MQVRGQWKINKKDHLAVVCYEARKLLTSKEFRFHHVGREYNSAADAVVNLSEGTPGHRRFVEKLWVQFFSDPSKWWDHRQEKVNAKYPDFKHKVTRDPLWLNSKLTPTWVEKQLAAMAPGKLQLNHFTWNRKIGKCLKDGHYRKAMEVFEQMQADGMNPDKFTFVLVLNACAGLQALEKGRTFHVQIMRSGFEPDLYVSNALLHLYSKCGSIEDARRVFNKMPIHDVVSWNTIIGGYWKCGLGQEALGVFQKMQEEGCQPDPVTFVEVLNACASVGSLDEGKGVHKQVIECGFDSNAFVTCCVINMYTKCGSLEEALGVFNKIPARDGAIWSAMILGCVKCGQGHKALELSHQMEQEGVAFEAATFVAILNACANVGALEEGKRLHEKVIQQGFESNLFVGNSLVDMYAKCGRIEDAQQVFRMMPDRDVVSFNAMIGGHVKCGQGQKALDLSSQMAVDRISPDLITFVGLLNACASLGALEEGKLIHQQIVERDLQSNVFVGNSLVDMYAKCGSIDDAWEVFKRMPIRGVVSWNAMILGLSYCGRGQEALDLYWQMKQRGVESDSATFVALLTACSSFGALEEGRRIHQQIVQSGHETDILVGNCLVDMYAKCGSTADALNVFNEMPVHDVVSWTAMLGGYAMDGDGINALKHFEWMCQEESSLNAVTFVSLLTACCHAGLVDEGLHYLQSMSEVRNIIPAIEHYACVVDLLGRAGHLHEAEDLIETMPCKPNAMLWTSILNSCSLHGNVSLGERAAKQVMELDPENPAGYVLLSKIYADAGKWDSSATINEEQFKRPVINELGCSWIEVNKMAHSFAAGDIQHPQTLEIHAEIQRLSDQMKQESNMPDMTIVSRESEEKVEKIAFAHHSEKLAIGFGLLKTPPGTALRIFTNLRMCHECHSTIKFIASSVERKIVVRDANRFHHFENGFCSCGDYW